jgi:hypothetical protein
MKEIIISFILLSAVIVLPIMYLNHSSSLLGLSILLLVLFLVVFFDINRKKKLKKLPEEKQKRERNIEIIGFVLTILLIIALILYAL